MRLQKEVFPYCPAWVLSWHYRKQVLLMELRRYNADILCLQARIALAPERTCPKMVGRACTGLAVIDALSPPSLRRIVTAVS